LGKLRVFSGSELCNLLQVHGFAKIRQKGSHIIMQKSSIGTTTTIPVPNHREIKIGTLQSIIRQSGLSKDLFEA